jgi:hypothetical protein
LDEGAKSIPNYSCADKLIKRSIQLFRIVEIVAWSTGEHSSDDIAIANASEPRTQNKPKDAEPWSNEERFYGQSPTCQRANGGSCQWILNQFK